MTSLLEIRYPEDLPCPAVSRVEPTPRTSPPSDSDLQSVRAFQRDRAATESVTFPPMTPTQFAAFRAWWRDQLLLGSRWFSASWPSPRGAIDIVRRFIGPPSWRFVPGGFFQISGELEVRGASLPPIRSPDTTLLMHFDGDFVDECGAVFGNASGELDIAYSDSPSALFGQQAVFSSANGKSAVLPLATDLIEAAEFQIDIFVEPVFDIEVGAGGAILVLSKENSASQNIYLEILYGTSDLDSDDGMIVVNVLDEDNGAPTSVDRLAIGSRDVPSGTRVHVRVTLKDGVFRQYHDGTLVATRATSTGIQFPVTGNTFTRVSVGKAPAGASLGATVFAAQFEGEIDELRIATEVTDTAPFDVPALPFTR